MIKMLGEMRQRVLHLPQEERKDEEGTFNNFMFLQFWTRSSSPPVWRGAWDSVHESARPKARVSEQD